MQLKGRNRKERTKVSTIVSHIITLFFMVPILGYILLFILFKIFTKNHRKSVHRALDYSTVLFIMSVHFLLLTIWGKSMFWLILLIMSCIGIMFVIIHLRAKGEIEILKVLKGFWRFNFLLFFFAYIGLVFFGLIQRVAIFVTIP
jgi:hypothetical protein